jgi:uncharacterized oxidoreductase
LNVLTNNAGVMLENLLAQQVDLKYAEATITTNLLGPIRLTAALLPLLRKQPHSTIINISSGFATVLPTLTPTYCATKAAIHSYTRSLRYQLRETTTAVLELIPALCRYGAHERSVFRSSRDAAGQVHCGSNGDLENPAFNC